MALLDLWNTSRDQLLEKHLHQIIAFAGDGKLRDGSQASAELRVFLDAVPSNLLSTYISECLTNPFGDSGLALQEVINQVGQRLGFDVEHGRYRGAAGAIGFDGLWVLPSRRSLIVEVKTTDAYRIDLNTLADYRRGLVSRDRVREEQCSILIVVGRQDTGDLEAQIRGSKHAWDIRLISVEALLRLLTLKEELEDPRTLERIHDLLFPREFTRLDGIVDLVFSAAEDARQDEEAPEESVEIDVDRAKKRFTPVSFHSACVSRIESYLRVSLVKKSRASFATADRRVAVVCAISREHVRGGDRWYWFAFHPHQRAFLLEHTTGHVGFGCGSEKTLLLIPRDTFTAWLEHMNETETTERSYWHVHLYRDDSRIWLRLSGDAEDIDVSEFLLP